MSTSELDDHIGLLRKNIADLTEQAGGASGAASEERLAANIEDQPAPLNDLLKQRGTMEDPVA